MSARARTFADRITVEDALWLAELGVSDGLAAPEPMVSAELYCATVDACDQVTRENFQLRMNRRRLWRRYCRLRRRAAIQWIECCVLGTLLLVAVLTRSM
jgi:hypothetical protein